MPTFGIIVVSAVGLFALILIAWGWLASHGTGDPSGQIGPMRAIEPREDFYYGAFFKDEKGDR